MLKISGNGFGFGLWRNTYEVNNNKVRIWALALGPFTFYFTK